MNGAYVERGIPRDKCPVEGGGAMAHYGGDPV